MPRKTFPKVTEGTKEDAAEKKRARTRARMPRLRERRDGITREYPDEIFEQQLRPQQRSWSQPLQASSLQPLRQAYTEPALPAEWADSQAPSPRQEGQTGQAGLATPVIPGKEREEESRSELDPLEMTLSQPSLPAATQDTLYRSSSDTITSDPLNTTLSAPSDIQDLFEDYPLDELESQIVVTNNGGDESSRDGETPVITLQDNDDEPRNDATVDWLAAEIARVRLTSNCSNAAIEKLLRLFIGYNDQIMDLYNRRQITQSYLNSIRPVGLKNAPKVLCAVKVRQKAVLPDHHRGIPERTMRDIVFEEKDLATVPRKYYQPGTENNYELVCQDAYLSLKDIKDHFRKTHSGITGDSLTRVFNNARIGIDGVKESQKSSRKLILITLQLGGCLYPWRIYNPLKGEKDCKSSAESQIRPCIDEIQQDADIRVSMVLADKVERHVLRCLPGVTGRHSCEFCVCPGMGIKGGWPFPYGTKYENRDVEEFKERARNVRGIPTERIDRAENQGILGYSPLLDLPDFDIIWDLPLDEFHLLREGITKLMMLRIFVQCQKPQAKAAFLRVNRVYTTMRVFSECPRRTRSLLRTPDFKGNEWLIVTLTVLPYIARHGIAEKSGVWMFKRKAICIYAFLARLYFYEDAKLAEVEGLLNLKQLHKLFYKYFQLGFAIPYNKSVPPNVHSFWHLLDSRKKTGPLWKTSTECYESMYAVVRRSFKAGTPNCPKQILQNFYLRDKCKHRCREKKVLRVKPDTKSSKYSDSWIRTGDGLIWKVNEKVSDVTVRCSPVKTANFSTSDMKIKLPWSAVGVFKYVDIEEGPTQVIHVDAISAKMMKCRNILAEWKAKWLMDSKCDY